jgi:hypothetical protein
MKTTDKRMAAFVLLDARTGKRESNMIEIIVRGIKGAQSLNSPVRIFHNEPKSSMKALFRMRWPL